MGYAAFYSIYDNSNRYIGFTDTLEELEFASSYSSLTLNGDMANEFNDTHY